MARTAVVILNYNGRHLLERFLPGVLAHSPGAELIVADNGSSDGSLEWVHSAHPTVRRLDLKKNLGFAGGYNAALAQVEADRFVLLNSDVEVTAGWLEALGARLDADPRMAACQPKVLAHADPGRFEHAGAAGGCIDRNGYPFCRGRIFEITEPDSGQYDDDTEVFWATGACLMIRAEAFHEVGGFDEALFAHMEEIDLCWRLRRRGWRIGYTSAARVLHVGGGALGYGSPFKTYLNFRNSLIVLTKNLRSRALFLRLLRRLVLDGFAALKFLLEGHPAHAGQVVRAHWSYFAALPRIMRQRRTLLAEERAPDLTGLYHRSIAYDRFILGWKKFSELDKRAFDQRR
ncbi:MAG: glycosyltransferase family 2 protein [Flavobacteriales bacterium]|jgi:GT2 family glycosyltransferase|nr:glycosyltransferase family 2 protein [Flavobacteriales bacterium]